ncbi:hypothetical protein [Chlorogloeopsis sp. ULAP02]|uniref:hypothetical protein n=1 Tax=Chlorogloeopsis sp. ULAP02 TaxID=3107926 RepID=UPI00313546E9
MNISTKFIGTSAFVVGLIAVVLGGITIWRNQMETSAYKKLEQASRTIELAWQVQAIVGHEVHALKDYVFLKRNTQIYKSIKQMCWRILRSWKN